MLKTLIKRLLGRPDRLTTIADRALVARLISPLPFSLAAKLKFFGSDKQRPGEHSYGTAYDRLFKKFRWRKIKLLEIGVLGGDSLLAWLSYFPRGQVIGADIEDKPQLAGLKRLKFYLTDQGSDTDLAHLAATAAPFDIIIDDGSHQSRHQIFTFCKIFNYLADDGVYVIEDVQTSFWRGRVNGFDWDGAAITDPTFTQTCYGWFLDLAKYVNHAEFMNVDGVDENKLALARQIIRISFEHNLIAIEKGDNREGSNLLT
jgi:hypothetical protein